VALRGTELEIKLPWFRARVRGGFASTDSERLIKSRMKTKLQYAYTIGVFFGVLVTAYLMMNREGNSRGPLNAFSNPALRSEATLVDPAVTQLFEMEKALTKKEKADEQRRVPTNAKPHEPTSTP
jgi:hypothetical protein